MREEGLDPFVRQEAEWRLKELNAARGQLQPGLSTAPPTQAWPTQAEPGQAEAADADTGGDEQDGDEPDGDELGDDELDGEVLNPDDEPLWNLLPSPQGLDPNRYGERTSIAFEYPRGLEANRFWEGAWVEPVMIRIGGSTGLTLATPSIHDDDERVLFLSNDQGIHVAQSVEGLIDLARQIGPWQDLASRIRPEYVVVLPQYMFDVSEAIVYYSDDSDDWNPSLLTVVYNFAYEMALHLAIDEVVEALAPDSALYTLYGLVRQLDAGGAMTQRSARRGIDRFDLADVYDAWCDIHDILADHIQWHPQEVSRV